MVTNDRLTALSFRVNQRPHPHSSNKAILNFDLSTTKSRSWVWSKGKTLQSAQYLTDLLIFFLFHINQITIPQIPLCWNLTLNKANLKDLIAATYLVILLKLDSNRLFFSPSDLEIWWMTKKNNRAPPLCYFKLFASFRSHWWIQTGVTVQKRLIWVKIDDFFLAVWPWNLTDDLQKQ